MVHETHNYTLLTSFLKSYTQNYSLKLNLGLINYTIIILIFDNSFIITRRKNNKK